MQTGVPNLYVLLAETCLLGLRVLPCGFRLPFQDAWKPGIGILHSRTFTVDSEGWRESGLGRLSLLGPRGLFHLKTVLGSTPGPLANQRLSQSCRVHVSVINGGFWPLLWNCFSRINRITREENHFQNEGPGGVILGKSKVQMFWRSEECGYSYCWYHLRSLQQSLFLNYVFDLHSE